MIVDPEPCHVTLAKPEDAVRVRPSAKELTLDVQAPGKVEVSCGRQRLRMEARLPARLVVGLVDGSDPRALRLGENYPLFVELRDARGEELEVGELTKVTWTLSGVLAEAPDRSAREFGFPDGTAFGHTRVRAVKPGEGAAEARLGSLVAVLRVEALR